MPLLITALLPLVAIGAMFRSLQNSFYALHLLLVGGTAWVLQPHYPQATAFSYQSIAIAMAAHLLAINFITLIAYRFDKRASIHGTWRVPERTLHGFALLGGTPAAWFASRIFKHKTRKTSFRIWFWIISVLQMALLVFCAKTGGW